MRRFLIWLVAVVVFIGVVPGQAETSYTSEGYTYTIADGQATITGCAPDGKTLNIPQELGGYPVTAVDLVQFTGPAPLESIFIPASVTQFSMEPFVFKSLKAFDIDPLNPVYETVDGVLFDKTSKTLVIYPQSKTGQRYEVPFGIKAIGDVAFYGNPSLNVVVLPDGVKRLGSYALSSPSLTAVVIPSSVIDIDPKAIGNKFSWLTLYGEPGSYAQEYAQQNGLAFGDALTFLSSVKESAEVQEEENAGDDPFAIFNQAGEGQSAANGSYAHAAGMITDLIWPKQAPDGLPGSSSSLVSAYANNALNAGKTLSTAVTVLPGSVIDSGTASILQAVGLQLYQLRLDGRDLFSYALTAGGLPALSVSGAMDQNALCAASSLLGDDLFILRRDDLTALIAAGAQSLTPHDRYGGTSDMGKLIQSVLREGSGFLEALTGADGQVSAFASRFTQRIRTEATTEGGELHDAAVLRETLSFTQDDLLEFLSLPQVYDTAFAAGTASLLASGYDLNTVLWHDPAIRTALLALKALRMNGDVEILRDSAGNVACITADIVIVMDDNTATGPFSGKINFTLNRKTEGETIRYTMKAGFTVQNAMEALLEGVWEQTGSATAKGTLRLRQKYAGQQDYTVDMGVQYLRAIQGTLAEGTETGQLNAYVKSYGHTDAFSVASSSAISAGGVNTAVRLFYEDLRNPALTVQLTTYTQDSLSMFPSSLWEPSGEVFYPSQWDMQTLQSYLLSRQGTIQAQVTQIMSMLPESLSSQLYYLFN